MVTQTASKLPAESADLLPAGQALPVYVIARALKCHRQHIVNLIEAGELDAIDLRGAGSSRSTMRVRRQSLLEWLESRSVLVPPSREKLARSGDKHARKR